VPQARGVARVAIVLAHLEIGQHIAAAPAGIAERAPAVEVRREPADIYHAVDRAGSAEHLAARPIASPPRERRLGLRTVHPVHPRVAESAAVAHGDANPEAAIRASRLEQQNLVLAALRQP